MLFSHTSDARFEAQYYALPIAMWAPEMMFASVTTPAPEPQEPDLLDKMIDGLFALIDGMFPTLQTAP